MQDQTAVVYEYGQRRVVLLLPGDWAPKNARQVDGMICVASTIRHMEFPNAMGDAHRRYATGELGHIQWPGWLPYTAFAANFVLGQPGHWRERFSHPRDTFDLKVTCETLDAAGFPARVQVSWRNQEDLPAAEADQAGVVDRALDLDHRVVVGWR